MRACSGGFEAAFKGTMVPVGNVKRAILALWLKPSPPA